MHIAPAKSGWKWLAEGLRLFRASPGRWTLLVVAYWLLIAIVNRIDYLGAIAVTICLPGFSASFMVVCDEIRRGHPLRLTMLFAGFQRNPRTMVLLGVIYLVSVTAVLGISALADGGVLMNWLLLNKPPDERAILEGKLSASLLLAAVAATPMLMAFWFAPLLAAFEDMSAAKSLFYSFFACWRNWRALCVYGCAVTIFAMFIAMFVALFAVLSGGNPNAARGFMLAATIVMMPTLFGSFYAAFVEIFPRAESPQTGQDE
ncbi:MAG: hypothetical protein A3H35_19040 [Betaproteobacteria bacterium RIFCSPLOWO2_02_FULL_62_17]|nr:MAG: hypothetical protein A3H35_19040 [Betaproteobacteria bacterium RIFCSPLOWO2_02_FULL_62_17]